jgi:hypothetical protein
MYFNVNEMVLIKCIIFGYHIFINEIKISMRKRRIVYSRDFWDFHCTPWIPVVLPGFRLYSQDFHCTPKGFGIPGIHRFPLALNAPAPWPKDQIGSHRRRKRQQPSKLVFIPHSLLKLVDLLQNSIPNQKFIPPFKKSLKAPAMTSLLNCTYFFVNTSHFLIIIQHSTVSHSILRHWTLIENQRMMNDVKCSLMTTKL